MNALIDWVQNTLNMDIVIFIKIIVTLFLFVFSWLLKKLFGAILMNRTEDAYKRYAGRKMIAYTITAITFIVLIWMWIAGIGSIATFLGLLSAGLAFALRDFLINIVGWMFIIWRKPFEVGDRIEISGVKGDIIDIRLFEFSVLEIANRISAEQSTGRVIHIPNGKVMSEPMANYTKEFNYIWNEIPLIITFESDWKKAKEFLLEIGNQHALHLSETAQHSIKAASRKFLIYYTKLTPTVYVSTRDYGVQLSLRYLIEPKNIRSSESFIWETLLERIEHEPDIELAYPTYRIFDRTKE